MNSIKKILWAVDPLENDLKLKKHSHKAIQSLAAKTKAKIEPIYVLSDGLLGLSIPKADLRRNFYDASVKAMKLYLKNVKIRNLAEPRVIVKAPSSPSTVAKTIDEHARKEKFDLVVVNSHGRSGIRRAALGSFAETLTLHCRIPTLILGPKTKTQFSFKKIVFSTDFSPSAEKAFEELLQFAKSVGGTIQLVHVVVDAIGTIFTSGVALLGGGYIGSFNEDTTEQTNRLKKLQQSGRSKGVKVQTYLLFEETSVASSILRFAQKHKSNLIAMASESGAYSAAILGSIGRYVARNSSCPVLFFRR